MEFEAFKPLGVPGWAELLVSGWSAPRLLAKFEERDGRLALSALLVTGEQIDSSMLRAVPVGRIEAAIQHPDLARVVMEPAPPPAAEVRAIDKALRAYLGKEPTAGIAPSARVGREPLARPDRSDPDAFYREVAAAYNSAVMEGPAPAKTLADEAGVPVTTVHRWIREARTRGHLPPARKGRAG